MKRKRYILLLSIFLLVLLVLLAGVSGMDSASAGASKVQDVSLNHMKMKNPDCENEVLNPLSLDACPEVTEAVNQYYISLADETDYVEYYEDIKVYTKAGYYVGSYVAFVRYDMKIKGIYTTAPGLGTLYVEKGEDGVYQVFPSIEGEEEQALIQVVAQHEDVQALLNETNEDYENALASDALLREALADLQNAYN